MEPADRVKAIFQEAARLQNEAAGLLAETIARASGMLATGLLNDQRILSCGNGGGAVCASYFATLMLNRFELERPGLPVMALACDGATLTSIADDYQYADIYAKQVRALANPGDILLAVSGNGNSQGVIHAIDAAHDRNMRVIALTGKDGGRCGSLLHDDDLEIRIPGQVDARILETQLTVIHSICDLIDRHLLGQED